MTKKAKVLEEVLEAYAECRNGMLEGGPIRKLKFTASEYVSRNVAFEIMAEAMECYSTFSPEMINEFPKNAKFLIGRNQSVCLIVKSKGYPTKNKVSATTRTPRSDGAMEYWWK